MGETRCQACGAPIEASSGPGRPRAYCDPSHRRLAERRRAAARRWAARDPALGAVDLDVPELDVDQVNAELSRMD
jgi:hypothetical protein